VQGCNALRAGRIPAVLVVIAIKVMDREGHHGFSKRTQTILPARERTGMYDGWILGQDLATLRKLVRELDRELAIIELTSAGGNGNSSQIRYTDGVEHNR
jgi:hypothetical protein